MADISKEELEKEIAKILKNANLASTSSKKVRQKLEKSFDCDLTEKRKVIDQLVMDYVNSKEDEGSEEEEEEEEEKKPAKRAAPKAKKRKESSEEADEPSGGSDSDEKPAPKKKRGKKKGSDGDSDADWGKSKKEKAAKGKKGGRGAGGGYTRAYKLSPALAALMGEPALARHEVVKRMWALIKEKNLYDPNNKQFAICDDALYKVIGTKRFRTFGMMKYLKTHFLDE